MSACKECWPGSKRPAPHPGPRCATHHRAAQRARKARAAATRVANTYGLDADAYGALLAIQDGACAICRRATGKTRRLAVDHDHDQAVRDGHDEDKGCPQCVRGLLCRPCNRMLGHLRDDPEAARRAADYLENWPSRRLASVC